MAKCAQFMIDFSTVELYFLRIPKAYHTRMAQISEVEMQEIRKRYKDVKENKTKDETLKGDCFLLMNRCDQTRASSNDEKYIAELEDIIIALEEHKM